MTAIYSYNFEAGNYTGLSQSNGGGGEDISVTTASKLAGTNYGVSVLIDDTAINYLFVTTPTTQTTGKARWRFYLDPNSLTMGTGDVVSIFSLRYTTSNFNLGLVQLQYLASAYKIVIVIYDDSGTGVVSEAYAISDAPHYIECNLIRAASNVSSDGSLQLWIDGVSKETISGIDNYDRLANWNSFRLGAITGKGATTSGTYYFDELIVNDDGGEIGALIQATGRRFGRALRRRPMRR